MNEAIEQEVHVIEDINTATIFELKHTPNVRIDKLNYGQRVKVSIGLKDTEHPQTEEHLIEWIKVYAAGQLVGEARFTAADTPVAEFELMSEDQVVVQAFCNLHGVWQA